MELVTVRSGPKIGKVLQSRELYVISLSQCVALLKETNMKPEVSPWWELRSNKNEGKAALLIMTRADCSAFHYLYFPPPKYHQLRALLASSALVTSWAVVSYGFVFLPIA